MAFVEDLDVFLADFGVDCVAANGYEFTGILDRPDESLGVGPLNAISTQYELKAKSADVAAGGLGNGIAVTVDGVAYVVRDVFAMDDGSFSRLMLTKT